MALLGAVVAEIVAVAVVYWYQDVDGASAGLVILYSLTFTENLNLIARMHAECQMLLNSVERVKEYSAVEQERYQDSDINSTESRAVMEGSHSQMKNWPSEGAVEFKDVCLSYSSSASDVLRSVSFSIEAGQKVGIVGRSGAGKSSCIAALFRMQEPRSGSLAIDGVEVLNLPLQLLRSRIAIVPQDPILFGGSVRSNLDPFHQYNDEELWAALRSIKLDEFVKSLPGQALDTKHIAEKGSNLSAGQKQLLCMARALVKRSRVLVMDEATASVDHETDALIQDTINKLTCTVICIAHRLHTVSSFQKVVVMREGRVHESGSPLQLLRNNDSLFKAMAISSGDFEGLYKIAVRNSTKLG
jgi:ABC-type multidrug transport system fused ATPase/permease subunit